MENTILLWLIAGIFLWDIYTTHDALTKGYGHEANPLLGAINGMTPADRLFILCFLKLLAIGALVYTKVDTIEGTYVYGAVLLVYGYIVAWGNTRLWWKNR